MSSNISHHLRGIAEAMILNDRSTNEVANNLLNTIDQLLSSGELLTKSDHDRLVKEAVREALEGTSLY